ncbi:hypothetical protein [Edaphobacter bradus]|uniref:hypothetical protein n=1 Tax=Edaphobacter bradus TaxID=2259016 RepID=UPI0021DFB892|nr:hypothetical protein [Edaphobacter bradus]
MLPTLRIAINPAEYSLLKPGLDLLANRLADARAGRFHYRHPWHRIDFLDSNIYRNRAFDESMAARLIEVRAKLWDLPSSRRIYVNFIDLSILAFALRQLRAADTLLPKEDFHTTVPALAQKLERFRKRTKRGTISAHGKQSYDEAAARWRRFSDWARYNPLYSKVPRRGTPFIKYLWRDNRVRMAELIKVAVKERYDFDLNEVQVNRICQLVIPSLRRGRHELTLNTVLSGSDAAKDFLIAFITKRFELKKGPDAPLTYWEQYFKRAERLGQAMKRQQQADRGVAGSLRTDGTDVSTADKPLASTSEEAKPQLSIRLTDQEIVKAVSLWFAENVHPTFWQDVCEEARHQVIRSPCLYRKHTISKSLRDLIQEVRPIIDSSESRECTNGYIDWLLGWMLALRSDLNCIFNLIGAGYAGAMKSRHSASYTL